jgi:hypothetical protein
MASFCGRAIRENMRVLKWIVDRVRGRALARRRRSAGLRITTTFTGTAWSSRATFDELQSVDRAQWKQEVMSHEELFLALHDHLPPEMIYERELLICRQMTYRIEDDRLAFLAALMLGDDFADAGDHHFVHVALHPYLAVSVRGWRRVVVRAIADQRQRTEPYRELLASFVRDRGQRQQCCTVALKPFSDGLCVPAPPPLTPLPANRLPDAGSALLNCSHAESEP